MSRRLLVSGNPISPYPVEHHRILSISSVVNLGKLNACSCSVVWRRDHRLRTEVTNTMAPVYRVEELRVEL